MNKKVWSIILLCLILLSFVFTIISFVLTGISLYQLENTEVDTSSEIYPGTTAIGIALVFTGLFIAFISINGITSLIGFVCSLVNVKISQNTIIRKISKVSLWFYSALLILIFSLVVFYIVSVI